MKHSRRDFLKKAAVSTAGLTLTGLNLQAQSIRNIPGANERIRVAVIGANSRGSSLARSIARSKLGEVAYICDVDRRVIEDRVPMIEDLQGRKPKGAVDFRKALDDESVDAVAIATPDHWHTPAGIMALKAGKHVYVEKPYSHNPYEAKLFVEAQKKYGKVVQVGTQLRSSPISMEAVREVQDGIIGRPYYGKGEYGGTRGSIGHGKVAPVPEWLNYELWQGPAPRTAYRDNVIHYNWHWFRRWGTGELPANGIHDVDLIRWAMGIDGYPVTISSMGERFAYEDDWEFPDTQSTIFKYNDRRMIGWESKSATGPSALRDGLGYRVVIYGTEGTIFFSHTAYEIRDLGGNKIQTSEGDLEEADDRMAGGDITTAHINDFLNSIKDNSPNRTPIDEAEKSEILCALGNISWYTGRTLRINPKTGDILDDGEAMQMWSRMYEPGWEPKI